jgi:hypothetical protein
MSSRVGQILKLLKFVQEDGNVVDAGKLFVANRVLTLAYDQVDRGLIPIENISTFVQALIEFREEELEFTFEIDKQTGEEQVYCKRLKTSIYNQYPKYFRQSSHIAEQRDYDGDEYAEEDYAEEEDWEDS